MVQRFDFGNSLVVGERLIAMESLLGGSVYVHRRDPKCLLLATRSDFPSSLADHSVRH